jgi:hypothetical protein
MGDKPDGRQASVSERGPLQGGEYGRIRDLSPGEAKMSTVKSGKQKLVTGRLCGQRRPPDNHCWNRVSI